MRRSLLLAGCTCLLLVSAVLVLGANGLLPQASNGLAVPPNQNPARGLDASSWACYPTCVLPSDIVVGDFNANGWPDLAVSCFGSGTIAFYTNRALGAPGVFTWPPPYAGASGSLPYATELVAMKEAGVAAVVLYNTGLVGTPSALGGATMTPLNAGPSPGSLPPATTRSIVGGDLDHDTRIDLVTLGAGAGQVAVMSRTAANAWAAPAPVAGVTGVPIAAAIGDLNQDGWNDIVVLATNGLWVSYNVGFANPAAFGPAVLSAAIGALNIAQPTKVALGDFDADGLLDIVVVGNNPQGGFLTGVARVLLNTPAAPGAGFTPWPLTVMKTWGFNAVDVVVNDFDGNGRDDFAVANRDSDTITVFLADALPALLADDRATTERCLPPSALEEDRFRISFQLYKLELHCGHYPIALTTSDFDWNGKPDLAIALLSADQEVCAQNDSCIEVLFDVACGFHRSGNGDIPNQLEHTRIPRQDRDAIEPQDCASYKDAPCEGNQPPEVDAEAGDSGN